MAWKSRAERCRAMPQQARKPTSSSARTVPRLVLRRPARVSNKPKTRVVTGEVRPGPRDFQAAMDDWVHEQRQALADNVPGSMECLDEVMERGIDVTTHYSGTGAAEIACAAVASRRVRFHGACDLNPTCRMVLLHHSPDSAAEHVTKDLCARPPPHIVEELKAGLRQYQDKAGVRARASTPSIPDRESVRAVELEWVDAAM